MEPSKTTVRKTLEQWIRDNTWDGDRLCVMELKSGAMVLRNDRTQACYFFEKRDREPS